MAKVTPQDATQLKTLLQRQVSAATLVLEKLKTERDALEQRKFDNVTYIQRDKHPMLAQINDAEEQRQQLMNQLGLDAGENGFRSFIAQVPPQWQTTFSDLWSQRKEMLEQCRHANEVNGRILHHTQQAAERVLALVRGQTSMQYIYNSKGGKGYIQGSRQLAVA